MSQMLRGWKTTGHATHETKRQHTRLYLTIMHCSDGYIVDFLSRNILMLASLSSACIFQCQRRIWHSVLSLSLSCSFVSVCDGFGKANDLCFFDPLFELSLLFFLYSSPLFPCFFSSSFLSVSPRVPLNPRCLSLTTRRLLPTFRPSVCPSFLPSFLCSLPMRRLSLWQTCAITRILWTIARLSIKGVISPQCPMPWQEWVPRPRSRPCPVAPGPSPTSTTASSARLARRPSRGSR